MCLTIRIHSKIHKMKPRYFFFTAVAVFAFLSFLPSVSADTVESGYIKKNALVTDHFRIEYSDLTKAQSDTDGDMVPDIVETVSYAAERSRDIIIDELGYEDPMADSSRELMIILDDTLEYLGSGEIGITSFLSNGDPFIAVNPWSDRNYLFGTVAHEFFHCMQFGYDSDFIGVFNEPSYQGINWAEANAVWSEDLVFGWIDSYIGNESLSFFFSYPDYSVFASETPDLMFKYGLNIWPRFLAEYYGDSVVRNIWEEYVSSSFDTYNNLKFYYAVSHVIRNKGDDLSNIFQKFTLWNLDPSKYEEGASYPEVFSIEGTETGPDYYMLIDEYYAPELFATNYLYFDNINKENDFNFHIVKPEGVSFAVSLVPYDNGMADSDVAITTIIDKNSKMDDQLVLSGIADIDGVYAVVSPLNKDFDSELNTGVFDGGYFYYYSADYSSESTLIGDSQENLIVDANITDKTSETDNGEFAVDSLTLSISDYDADSVTLSWNSLINQEITSYEIHYGKISGDYSDEKKINQNHLTSTIITGLEEGETYYFELHALGSQGEDVVDPSQEVAVTTGKWIFSDVSFMDEHFGAISALTESGILKGYSDGSFGPTKDINRAELLKVLIEARGIAPDSQKYNNCFLDVEDDWYAPYVCYAKNMGWVKGYSDGTFRPSTPVNKVEALKILFQVYEAGLYEENPVASLKYPDLDTNAWYAIYVWKASQLGILEESPGINFNPSAYSTRGGVAEEVYRYLVGLGEL